MGLKPSKSPPASFAEFLLRNGRAFKGRPLPARYSMKMPRMCYFNSSQIVGKNHRLRYCEGYVILADLGIPIQHAWAIDPYDRVVDVTLQDYETGKSRSGMAEYFGIVFERRHLVRKYRGSGLLADHCGVPRLDI